MKKKERHVTTSLSLSLWPGQEIDKEDGLCTARALIFTVDQLLGQNLYSFPTMGVWLLENQKFQFWFWNFSTETNW